MTASNRHSALHTPSAAEVPNTIGRHGNCRDQLGTKQCLVAVVKQKALPPQQPKEGTMKGK